jgi:hypothetical protein
MINSESNRFILDFEYPGRIERIIENKFLINNNIGVDWRDSPKEDKQRFTKLCEVCFM